MLAFLIAGVCMLAYANGANDNFKATATLFGSRALNYRSALTLATIAQIAGSVASVALAGALLKAFSGKGLVPASVVGDSSFLIAVAVGAAATVLLATRLGIPVSTTHALIGGLIGAGLVLASGRVAWSELGAKYFLPLLVSPMLAMCSAAVLYPPMRFLRKRLRLEATTCICVGTSAEAVNVMPDGSMTMQRSGMVLTVAEQEACTRIYSGALMGVPVQRAVDMTHAVSGFSLGFARGLNDTPKILALLVAAGWSGLDPRVSLTTVAVAMAVGGLIHSRKVAETMSHRITEMNRGQGLIANVVASSLVIGASLIGSPVSTTHVSTGAIFGIGLWSGKTDWKVAGGIVLAWVATLPLGAMLSAGVALVLRGL